MIERLDPERVRSFAFRAGCASQVLWLTLTDLLIYIASPHRDPLGYPDLVTHAIWLAPILALWIVRRSPSATILYALSLFAILVSRLDDCLRVVMYGHYAVPRLTGADLAAAAIGAVSLAVIFFWLLDRLIDLVFISIQRIVRVFRDG